MAVKSMPKGVWPTEITVPSSIGRLKRFTDDGPCCAVGYAQYEFCVTTGRQSFDALTNWHGNPICYRDKRYNAWYSLYLKLFQTVRGIHPVLYRYDITDENEVELINDAISASWRKTMYLLTWAKLGYTEGMPSNVLTLLEQPEIKAVKVND
jgi:hypothetical protein